MPSAHGPHLSHNTGDRSHGRRSPHRPATGQSDRLALGRRAAAAVAAFPVVLVGAVHVLVRQLLLQGLAPAAERHG